MTLSLNNIAELRPPQYIVPLSHLPVMLSEVVIYHVNVCSSLDNEDMNRQITRGLTTALVPVLYLVRQ